MFSNRLRSMNQLWLALYISSTFIFFPTKASAYLDPGTGSYVIQIVLAFVIGGLYGLKLYYKKIILYIQRLVSKEKNDSGHD